MFLGFPCLKQIPSYLKSGEIMAKNFYASTKPEWHQHDSQYYMQRLKESLHVEDGNNAERFVLARLACVLEEAQNEIIEQHNCLENKKVFRKKFFFEYKKEFTWANMDLIVKEEEYDRTQICGSKKDKP